MKATGVVRKIDHLGRIVIPKEIRKNLKIRDGENLEIYVEEDAILLRKSSSLSGLQEFAKIFVEVIVPLLKKNLIITDMNTVIACNREIEQTFLNKELSSDYLNLLSKREVYVGNSSAEIKVLDSDSVFGYYLLVPIVIQGDLLGSLLLFSEKDSIQEDDKMMLKFILKFLEKNIEE